MESTRAFVAPIGRFILLLEGRCPRTATAHRRVDPGCLGYRGLGLYLRARGTPVPTSPNIWWSFAGMGALNNLIPFALIFLGQTIISSGLASILIATAPVFSLLAAHAFTSDERLSASKVVGISLGLVGVIALVGIEAVTGSWDTLLAILACLCAALSYGLANVFGRRFKRMGVEPTVGAFGQITATAMIIAPIALIFDTPWQLSFPRPTVCVALVGLALLSAALAYIIFFRLLATAGATNTSLVTLLIPVSAILLGNLFLGEHLSTPQFGGMALIGFGLIAMDGRFWKLRPN